MRSYVITCALVGLVLVGLGVGISYSGSVLDADVGGYDTNGNGKIDRDEALAVVIKYFSEEAAREDVLQVLDLYLTGTELGPTPIPTPYRGDVTPPAITDITVEPSGVDVSARDRKVRVTLRVNDDLSGIQYVYVTFRSPSGRQYAGADASLVSGTRADGVYLAVPEVLQYSEPGTWWIDRVDVYDRVNNRHHYDLNELTFLGLDVSFQVGGPEQDSIPTGLRRRALWTEENPATLEELEWEIEKYKGASFVLASWDGEYGSAQQEAYLHLFASKFGINIHVDAPMSYDRIPEMVQSGSYTWHVMDVGAREIWSQIERGNLAELDMSVVDNRNHIETARNRFSGGGGSTWSTVLAYNTDVYPEGAITDWTALFDRDSFPGRRSVSGLFGGSWFPALLGLDPSRLNDPEWRTRLGSPTDEDVQEALRYWRANPPDDFWYGSRRCSELLFLERTDMCTAYSHGIFNRIFNARHAQYPRAQPITVCWECGHLVGSSAFVMGNGLKEADPYTFDLGQLFIAWTGQPEINANLARYYPYGPVNLGAVEHLKDPAFDFTRHAIPTSPENLPYAVFSDAFHTLNKYDEWVDLWHDYVLCAEQQKVCDW